MLYYVFRSPYEIGDLCDYKVVLRNKYKFGADILIFLNGKNYIDIQTGSFSQFDALII